MKCQFFLIITLLTSACATVSSSVKDVTLNDVEYLRFSKLNKAEIEKKFGTRHKVISKFEPNEFWIYGKQLPDGSFAQTASFTFDQNGNLLGALWTPVDSQDSISLQQILARYKNLKFNISKTGWDKQGHVYSEDLIYSDESNGVSFTVNASDKSVSSVSFAAPAIREPAKL